MESFHLYDRLGRAVSHNERLHVDRVPAIVELCVQAGFDIPEYPTRRRAFPAYCIAGRIIDFERRFPKIDAPDKDISTFGFWHKQEKSSENFSSNDSHNDDIEGLFCLNLVVSFLSIIVTFYVCLTLPKNVLVSGLYILFYFLL